MNYEYCKIFYYVGKHKNITKATAELYSSQPAVSSSNKSGVEFTHEGLILYEYARIAYIRLFKAEDEVSRSVCTEGGTIYIGTTITALYRYLFKILNDFREKHPKSSSKLLRGRPIKL